MIQTLRKCYPVSDLTPRLIEYKQTAGNKIRCCNDFHYWKTNMHIKNNMVDERIFKFSEKRFINYKAICRNLILDLFCIINYCVLK